MSFDSIIGHIHNFFNKPNAFTLKLSLHCLETKPSPTQYQNTCSWWVTIISWNHVVISQPIWMWTLKSKHFSSWFWWYNDLLVLYIIVLLSLATIAFPFMLLVILLGSTQTPRICVVGHQVVHWSNNIMTLKLFFHQAHFSSIYFGCIIWCQNESSHHNEIFCFDEMQVVLMGQLW